MASVDPLAGLRTALAHLAEPRDQEQVKLATVTGYNTTGVLVHFDGEGIASTRRYKNTHPVFVGMRVLMQRVGSTWIVNGDVDGSPAYFDLTYINGWTTFSGNSAYRLQARRNQGMVTVRGVVAPTVSWTTAWATLGTGYRPDQDNIRVPVGQGGPDTYTQADIYAANGNIAATQATSIRNSISVTYLSINITFPVGA